MVLWSRDQLPVLRNKTPNTIILEGNLVKDPDARLTPKGTPVCNFSLASNRYYKQDGVRQNEVSYFDVEVWMKVAESCEKHLNKGVSQSDLGSVLGNFSRQYISDLEHGRKNISLPVAKKLATYFDRPVNRYI